MKIETECDVCGKPYKADEKDLKKGTGCFCSKKCENIFNDENSKGSKKQSKTKLDSFKYQEYKE